MTGFHNPIGAFRRKVVYIYDEEKEGVPVSDLKVCPVCMVTADKLVRAEDGTGGGKTPDREKEEPVKKQETR